MGIEVYFVNNPTTFTKPDEENYYQDLQKKWYFHLNISYQDFLEAILLSNYYFTNRVLLMNYFQKKSTKKAWIFRHTSENNSYWITSKEVCGQMIKEFKQAYMQTNYYVMDHTIHKVTKEDKQAIMDWINFLRHCIIYNGFKTGK